MAILSPPGEYLQCCAHCRLIDAGTDRVEPSVVCGSGDWADARLEVLAKPALYAKANALTTKIANVTLSRARIGARPFWITTRFRKQSTVRTFPNTFPKNQPATPGRLDRNRSDTLIAIEKLLMGTSHRAPSIGRKGISSHAGFPSTNAGKMRFVRQE